ncbi:MAG TPA: metallophosphoesterase [Thermodesulfovibrionales bacterium]|nr:metallophosphoesterase [Thermodesulfovibrionales bacterium]
MTLFLFTFFLVYGSVHVYAFLRAKAALDFSAAAGVCLLLFMLVMGLAPIIIHALERAGLELSARIMAYIGYTWMGVLFLFFSYSLAVDFYRLLVYLGGVILGGGLSTLRPSPRSVFFLPLVLSLATSLYGYFEAMDIRAERWVLKSPKIPLEVGRIKIVQISDVHLGLIVREERLKRILRWVKAENPDILVSTGDLVDGEVCRLNELAELLKEIKPGYGKFAVTGNHEFIAGFENAKCFIENAGFTLLRGEGITVRGMLNIAGVDDPTGKRFGLARDVSERSLLSSLPREKFTLVLKHRPLVSEDAKGLFDLQLSGHVHKGQIFPFSIITWLYYPVDSGKVNLTDTAFMYVSRGAGTWGPPIRFLSPPEVAIIELVHGS